MGNLAGFNANDVPDDDFNFDPIPAGKYLAIITESDMKPTKAGTGEYLQLTFQILEGEYKGRKVWTRLNLVNPKELTVRIAKAELAQICKAINVIEPDDAQDLHDLPLIIDVRCKKGQDGEIRNEIKGYEKKAAAVKEKEAPKQNGADNAPWKRKPA